MLASPLRLYRSQSRLAGVAAAAARRAWRSGSVAGLVAAVAALQTRAAQDAGSAVEEMVAEQGLDADPVSGLVPASLAGVASDGRPLASLLRAADSVLSLETMVRTQVADAGRVAEGIATAVRPRLDGHTRFLTAPSCARCAILAGRFYRWSAGFLRHPRCDCVMVPTTVEASAGLVSDPMAEFRAGQIRGMSKADVEAVREGADLGRVVNVRRKSAGLSIAGRTVERGGRPTPEGIYRFASDRDEALSLLERFGYIR